MPNAIPKWTRQSVSSRLNKPTQERHRVEVSAGGLVFRRVDGLVSFAMVMDSYGKWAFPKGHSRVGERYKDTAEREIAEEMGLKELKLIAPLQSIDIWFRDRFVYRGKLVHKYIHYFLFQAPAEAKLVCPKREKDGENIQAVEWVPALELSRRSSYKDMKPVINQALRLCGVIIDPPPIVAPRSRR